MKAEICKTGHGDQAFIKIFDEHGNFITQTGATKDSTHAVVEAVRRFSFQVKAEARVLTKQIDTHERSLALLKAVVDLTSDRK